MIRKKLIIVGIVLFLIVTPFIFLAWLGETIVHINLPSKDGKNQVLILPYKDRVRLEYLFDILFAQDSFAYTLLGNKPMSLHCFLKPPILLNSSSYYFPFLPYTIRRYLGIKTWEKYKDYFDDSNFTLWSQSISKNRIEIYLVNKNKAYECFKQFSSDFECVLKRKDLENILMEGQSKIFLEEVLKNHDGLIGTLLGYGRDNAWLFNCKKPLKGIWVGTQFDLPFWSWYYDTPKFQLPSFMCDYDSVETAKIRLDYIQTKERILEYYQDKNVLEATLEYLIQNG